MKFFMIIFLLTQLSSLWAGSFTEYPGAKFDKELTEKAKEESEKAGVKSQSKVYFTSDSIEKVKNFYLKSGKEFKMGRPVQKLNDGTIIEQYFIIFDDAKTINTSSEWLSIQTPFIGNFEFKNGKIEFRDIRKNLTSIQIVFKK